MRLREQAQALILLRRWRDMCLDANRTGDLETDTVLMIALYVETDRFLTDDDSINTPPVVPIRRRPHGLS